MYDKKEYILVLDYVLLFQKYYNCTSLKFKENRKTWDYKVVYWESIKKYQSFEKYHVFKFLEDVRNMEMFSLTEIRRTQQNRTKEKTSNEIK